MQTLRNIVEQLREAFTEDTRTNGETFVKLADGSPEWMSEVVRKAHCDMLPDDWRYKMIRECVRAIHDAVWTDDTNFERLYWDEIADGLVDIMNWERLQWLASSLYRAQYCDDAQEEGLIENCDMFTRIAAGQHKEYYEILDTLGYALLDVFAEQNENQE